MAPITIRVRSRDKTVRVSVEASATVAALRQAAAKELGLPVASVTLSAQPSGTPLLSDAATLASLGLANGAMLYSSAAAPPPAAAAATNSSAGAAAGAATAASSSSAPAPAPAPALTPRCQHGAGGACHHCLPPSDDDFAASKAEPLNKAGRFAARHLAKSSATAGQPSGDMEWLCRHRPDAMCVNCAPLRKGEAVELPMLCLHGPEGRCTNCLPPDTTVDNRKFITWGEHAERRKARCEHAYSAVCVNCAPPVLPRYALKPGCGRHPAWPRGICLDCAPPPVDLGLQPYRHVDYIQVHNYAEMGALVQLWDGNRGAGLQRAGLLYGRYRPDANFRHGVKAVVEAIYEPPQRCDPVAGTVALLPEAPTAVKARDAVAAALGLTQVGWLLTRRPPPAGGSGKPGSADGSGGGNPLATVAPFHLVQMAQQQLAHPVDAAVGASTGLAAPPPASRFVTLMVTRAEGSGAIEPQGFMASDQLVALVRDGVLAPPPPPPGPAAPPADVAAGSMFHVRAQKPGEPPLPDVIRKDTVRGRYKSDRFEPEFGLVTLEAGRGHEDAAKEAADGGPLFKHASFPVENRAEFGIVQSPAAMQRHLAAYRSEPYQSRLSDFHALLYLAQLLDTETAVAAAAAVAAGTPFSEGLQLIMQSLEG